MVRNGLNRLVKMAGLILLLTLVSGVTRADAWWDKKWQFRENSTVGLFLETGTLEIVYGNKKHTLHANEAVYFDAGVPHKIKNIDSIEAKLFIVTSPSLF